MSAKGNTTLDRYEILKPLGQGGMGEVFLAQDTLLDRQVALKFLSQKLKDNPTARARFFREAKAAASLDHPFICKIYETGETEGKIFIVMEYVAGETLEERLHKGALPLDESLRTALEIAEALQAAHEKNIVHRDLKPSNVMLTQQGHAKVLDFGLAKRLPPPGALDSDADTFTSEALTRAGTAVGTLPYMSPEQARGESVDCRSDIFSFGVLIQEMISAEHPFRRESGAELLTAILRDPPPPLPEEVTKALPRLEEIVHKALAKDANERYPDMKELVGDLRELKAEVTGKMRPLLKWSLMAASLVLMVVLVVGTWWFAQRGPLVPPQELQPISVLIADFENQTGDAVFDGALEPTLKIGLEAAPFITTYNRGQALRIAGQIRPGAGSLDEELARLVAQREGINVIAVSSITRQGEGYGISLNAIDAITGESIAREETEAETGEDILTAIAKLAAGVRTALGDTTPEAIQLAAAETFTAASLEAARSYALAQELQGQGKWEEAIPHYSRSVELDPGLGRGYAGLAVMYRNVGEIEEAEKYYQMAMANIDRMTDREKYRTRGGYYVTSRDFEHAIEEYRRLVDQYPADFVGHSNLALSYFYGRDMRGAFEEQQRALEIYPQNVVLRTNLALYAMYSGDFETAEREAQAVLEEFPSYELVLVCVALSQLGQERISDAAATYQRLQGVSTRGVSIAASGLADLALYQGRLENAVQILEKGIALDDVVGILQQGLTGSPAATTAARKAASLGEAHLARGQLEAALAAAQQAVALSREENVLFLAARLYLAGERENQALQLASELSSGLQPEPQAYAKLIEGGVELKRGRVQDAIRLFREAQNLADTWLGRLELGRAYVAAGAYTEAYSELESALKRRGEATAVFLDDIPTYRYLPPVYYYLGRAQEGLNSPAAAESYQTFLDIKENSDQDPLVTDARRRLETR